MATGTRETGNGWVSHDAAPDVLPPSLSMSDFRVCDWRPEVVRSARLSAKLAAEGAARPRRQTAHSHRLALTGDWKATAASVRHPRETCFSRLSDLPHCARCCRGCGQHATFAIREAAFQEQDLATPLNEAPSPKIGPGRAARRK